jgi:CHAT domain-containing protein
MSSRRAALRVVALVAIGILVAAGANCGTEPASAASSSRLGRSFFDVRFATGRLAGESDFHACGGVDSLAGRVGCDAPVGSSSEFKHLAEVSRSARQRLDSDSSVEALHDAAVLSLRLRDSIKTGLDDAARYLTRARRTDSTNTAVLNDFAVVELELGEREQTIKPFLAALDAADRSLRSDSTFLPALFNRALALERLHLLTIAQQAWRRYANMEHDPSWKRAARQHMDALARESALAPMPQGGRDSVFKLLGDWGHAVLRHEDTQALVLLDAAHRVVATLDTLHSDQSLRFTVALVDSQVRAAERSPSGRKTFERLAAAHADLGDGFRPYLNRARYEEAIGPLQRAERELHALGSAAGAWASLYLASTEINQRQYDVADERLQRIAAEAFPQQPALIGKTIWTRGVIQVRRGNYESATSYYREAAPYMARAREPDNEGVVSLLISESLSSSGQYAAGRAETFRALRLLAPYRKLSFLTAQLSTVADYARADSLPFAALSVMDEVLSVALDVGKPDQLGLAYGTRALDFTAIGRHDSAMAALASGMKAIEPLMEETKVRYRADLELVRGQIERRTNPQGALPVLARVAAEYRRLGIHWEGSKALYEAAIAARDAGDSVQARKWLEEAIAQIERQEMTFEQSESRAALFEAADDAFDAMIDLELRAGHSDSAFSYLERERAAARFSTSSSSSKNMPDVPSLDFIRRQLPADMVFVEYALLKDRAIAWVVSPRGVRQQPIAASRDSIARLVQRFVKESTIPRAHDGDARSQLFELLLAPLRGDLAGAAQLTVVCDRELTRLPFAALWDSATRQYVVERYTVRTEPSASFLFVARGPRSVAPPTALVVGEPLLDSASTRLGELPGAKAEAEHVAALYPNRTLLTGDSAARDTVVSLLRTHRVFHFAGHAVFNEDRPELSYLALAAPHGHGGDGALEARDISELRLPNLELVVLSACRSLSSRPSRTGAVAGLASSFLRAGSPAIISSLWDVSDDVTGPLLSTFHRLFAGGTPAPSALRRAQLEALKSPSSERAAPAAWAAFIYAGP